MFVIRKGDNKEKRRRLENGKFVKGKSNRTYTSSMDARGHNNKVETGNHCCSSMEGRNGKETNGKIQVERMGRYANNMIPNIT